MPVYAYRGRDTGGRLIEGSLEAESERAVIAQLRTRGYLPTMLKEQVAPPSVAEQMGRMVRVPRRDLVLFTRELATMISAGLPLLSGLEIAARQTDSPRLRTVLNSVRDGIEAGGNLSGELAKFPAVFSDLYVNLIQAGEAAGALDRVLVYIADYLERDLELVQRVKTTAVYPLIVLGTAVAVAFFAVFFVLPRLLFFMRGLPVALPWPTKVLLAFTGATQHYWYALLAAPVLFAAGLAAIRRSPEGRAGVDRTVLRLPLLGRLALKISLARFARMFAMIARSGVPLVQGMEIVARSAGNTVITAACEGAAARVREGQPVAAALGSFEVFPPMLWRMVAVGEQTGGLEDVLDKAADYYERDVDNTMRQLAALIEPAMVIFVGGVVAFVAIAILLPLWRLIGTLR
ncbi:MAG TPA: type II secretion system F family protein [bacterium]|nr:type II secretion system F family protein [bacterium]